MAAGWVEVELRAGHVEPDAIRQLDHCGVGFEHDATAQCITHAQGPCGALDPLHQLQLMGTNERIESGSGSRNPDAEGCFQLAPHTSFEWLSTACPGVVNANFDRRQAELTRVQRADMVVAAQAGPGASGDGLAEVLGRAALQLDGGAVEFEALREAWRIEEPGGYQHLDAQVQCRTRFDGTGRCQTHAHDRCFPIFTWLRGCCPCRGGRSDRAADQQHQACQHGLDTTAVSTDEAAVRALRR